MYAQRVPQQHRLPLRLSPTYWVRHRKKLDHCRERWLRGLASALAARIHRGLAVLITALITVVLLTPIPAQAIDSVQVRGDLETLVNAGKMFKIVIDSKTGKTVFGSEKQFHRDLATDNGIPENRYLGGLIKRNAGGSWTIELYPKNKFPQWQSEAYVQKYFNLLQADPVGQHLVNPGTLPKLTVKVNERPLALPLNEPPALPKGSAGPTTSAATAPIPKGPGAPKDPTRGARGETNMHTVAKAPRAAGGLELGSMDEDECYPSLSNIARGGGQGGNGFDGLYQRWDSETKTHRYVIGESKSGQHARLEYNPMRIFDEYGNDTGENGLFYQMSEEWVHNVINRMLGPEGSDCDRKLAKLLRQAQREDRLDGLIVTTNDPETGGTFEQGPIPGRRGSKSAKENYYRPGRAAIAYETGTWDMKDKRPQIPRKEPLKIGCDSPCKNGSRFEQEAVQRVIESDPTYNLLPSATDVNPYYIVPSAVALSDAFKQYRTTALAEALTPQLPSGNPAPLPLEDKIAQKAAVHFQAETDKSLIDRQRYWSTLLPEAKREIERTRSLYDELKDTPKGLNILRQALTSQTFARLAWSYYQGGREGLKYAIGQMLIEGVKRELVELVTDWTLTEMAVVAAGNSAASAAAKAVLSEVLPGIREVMYYWRAVQTVYYVSQVAHYTYRSVDQALWGDQRDAEAAEAHRAAQLFIIYLRAADFANVEQGRPRVTFTNLCQFYRSRAGLRDRLDLYEQQRSLRDRLELDDLQYPSSGAWGQGYGKGGVWDRARKGLEQSWLMCETGRVLDEFFAMADVAPDEFCEKLSKPEMLERLQAIRKKRRLGYLLPPSLDDGHALIKLAAARVDADDAEEWSIIAREATDRYERCRELSAARIAFSEPQKPSLAEDLQRLEERQGTEPDPTVFLLADTTAQEERSAKAGEKVSIATTAVLWGLPNTRNITIRLRSYLQDARGGQWPLRDESPPAFEFDKEAYTPAELSRFMPLQDDFTLDPQLPEGPATYTVELYRDTRLIEARRVLINREDAASPAATPSTQAGTMVTWVRKGPFFSSNDRCLPDEEPSPDIKKCGPQDKQVQISGTTMTLTSDRTGRSNSLEWTVEAPETLKAGDEIKLTLKASRDYEGPVVGGWWNIEGESEGKGDKSAGSAKNYRLSGSPDPHSATYTFKFDPGFGDPYVQLSAGNDFSPELWVLVTYKFEEQPAK